MISLPKPRIKLVSSNNRGKVWLCSGDKIARYGASPKGAYNNWLYAFNHRGTKS